MRLFWRAPTSIDLFRCTVVARAIGALLGADPSRHFGWRGLTRRRPISDALCRFRGTSESAPCRPAAASGAFARTRFTRETQDVRSPRGFRTRYRHTQSASRSYRQLAVFSRKVIAWARLRPRAKRPRTRFLAPSRTARVNELPCVPSRLAPLRPRPLRRKCEGARCVRPTCAIHTIETCTHAPAVNRSRYEVALASIDALAVFTTAIALR